MSASPPSALGRSAGRKVGVEIEFGGIGTLETARIIADELGGTVEHSSPYAAVIRDTSIGDLSVELDWSWIQKAGDDGGILDQTKELLAELGRDVVPTEIVAPPLAGDRVGELDLLVRALAENGAKGTRAGLLNGFGMHLNPELWETDLNATTLRKVLQAYLLMSADLREAIQVDFTRSLLPFVAAFGDDYMRHVLHPEYDPDMATLIDDYIAFNPTRNRELDMLPVFAHIDAPRVRGRLTDQKISSRPTFHWRLPNADLESPFWSITHEWERWLSVEELAIDEVELSRRVRGWARDRARSWLERI
ncbi:amidoligase family protein [Thalassobaculum sp. OXR-137]|uniref:amidoligase family protein n=1 Tax=Thalassobaculum sp. OXR-137 TaxID=3100173 RepID=UPI002AC98BF7|nr:amidoligase family protein [Thalassobaculum sp. OXR-137]WPZ36629.1 amidoligase family protein [Thalassobaculum sp. OXR-137]